MYYSWSLSHHKNISNELMYEDTNLIQKKIDIFLQTDL